MFYPEELNFKSRSLGGVGTFFLFILASQPPSANLRLLMLCLLNALVRHRQLKHGRLLAFVEKR